MIAYLRNGLPPPAQSEFLSGVFNLELRRNWEAVKLELQTKCSFLDEKLLWENETRSRNDSREKVLTKFKFLLPINLRGQVYLSPVYCLVMWANYFLFLEFTLILVTKTVNKGKLKLLPYFNFGNEKWISYIQECKLVQPLWRNNVLLSSKVKDIHTYDLRIPLLDIHF